MTFKKSELLLSAGFTIKKDIDQMESRKSIKELSDWLKQKGCLNKLAKALYILRKEKICICEIAAQSC